MDLKPNNVLTASALYCVWEHEADGPRFWASYPERCSEWKSPVTWVTSNVLSMFLSSIHVLPWGISNLQFWWVPTPGFLWVIGDGLWVWHLRLHLPPSNVRQFYSPGYFNDILIMDISWPNLPVEVSELRAKSGASLEVARCFGTKVVQCLCMFHVFYWFFMWVYIYYIYIYIYILNFISWVQSKSYRTACPCIMCWICVFFLLWGVILGWNKLFKCRIL